MLFRIKTALLQARRAVADRRENVGGAGVPGIEIIEPSDVAAMRKSIETHIARPR